MKDWDDFVVNDAEGGIWLSQAEYRRLITGRY